MLRIALAALVALVAVSPETLRPASGASKDVQVRSFEEVRASDLVFVRDPSDPTRGVFRVTTSEPMICALVWGPDQRFGRLNNSVSMSGTGTVEHDVVLPDVEAGVRYSYVVQGTTADGTLYRSKVGTFVLPAVRRAQSGRDAEGRPNLAAGASVVEASSEFSSSFAAGNAIDGDTRTEWSTRGDGDDGSIVIDLGMTSEIDGVEFLTRSMPDGSAITKMFTVTADGGPPQGPFRAGTITRPRLANVRATGRIVRFDVASSTGGNVGATEIRVFAAR